MRESGRLTGQEVQEEGGRDSMKWLKKIRAGLLALSMLTLTAGQTALASDTAYTYTIRLYAGNQGVLTGAGITAAGSNAKIEKVTGKSGQVEQIVVSGVAYGEAVYINPNDAAKVTDERYYIRGVRRSGRDNSEAVASTGAVGADMDYVIAYGVSGEMTPYTINYQDAAGNALLPSDTYYGNIGERQYVSARYVDGYQPQAYNMVMTLSANSAENVFNFVYTPEAAPATPETPAATPATTPAATQTGTPAAGAAAPADAGAAATPEDAGTPTQGVGGDVAVPDEAVPEGNAPAKVEDKDEEVPMAESMKQAQPGTVMGYLPIYIGIGAAALLALVGTAFYLHKRRKAAMVRTDGQTPDDRG